MTTTDKEALYAEFEREYLEGLPERWPELADALRSIAKAVWTFEWATRPDATIQVHDDDGRAVLQLTVWVADSDADDPTIHPLVAETSVTHEDGPHQIRTLIHWWLCHEADEQLLFDGKALFYPHDETGATITVR